MPISWRVIVLAILGPSTIGEAALAFRGYNTTNLGRTKELIEVPKYAPVVEEELARFGAICSEFVNNPIDLSRRVKYGEEPGLDDYEEAISLIAAVETAHIRLLNEIHEIDTASARLSFGYSLGELAALELGGMFHLDDMIRIPLAMARDCVALAEDVKLGVLFSIGPSIDEDLVHSLCLQVTGEQRGTIGVSAVLSPNSYLLIGQEETVKRFRSVMHDMLPKTVHLRINSNLWPPLHTPIIRQKNIPDRSSVMMESLTGGVNPAIPPVCSLATGEMSYSPHSAREVLRRWVDHPQRLWDAITQTLSMNVDTVVHVGPEPNVIPATFKRLSENVVQQTSGSSFSSFGMRAVSGLARRPWLASILPANTALLRAPHVEQVILEDWLIENALPR